MESSDKYLLNLTLYRLSEGGETAIGVYLVLLGWLSWIGNGIVIVIMSKKLQSIEPQDLLILNLAVADAGISIFGYSRGILEVFNNGLLKKSVWTCTVDGFLILLFGLISINTLTAISVIRYIKGCQPHHAYRINKHNVSLVIAAVWLSALFWSGAPLVGWGSYAGRRYGTCEIDWMQARFSLSYKLYVIGILLLNLFVPAVVIVFSYISIIRSVSSSHKSSKGGVVSERQRNMEHSITRVSFTLCTAFLLAWSPYAVVSMWSACGYQVPPLTSILASLFAKSASFYNPFIYILMSSRFRKDWQDLFHCLQQGPTLRDPPECLLQAEQAKLNIDQPKDGQLENVDSEVELGPNENIQQGDREGLLPQPNSPSSPLVYPSAPFTEHGFLLRKYSDSGRL